MKKIVLTALVLGMCGCSAQEGMYGIDHFFLEEEGEEMRQAFDQLTADTFEWYQSIEGNDGVYIIHYDLFGKELMKEWKENGIYETVPEEDLSYFVSSENYLSASGYSLYEEEKELIHSGVRLYLIPETMDKEEAERTTAFLREEALYGLREDPMIPTAFTADPRVEFHTYQPFGVLKAQDGTEVKDPVIFCVCCDNMKYFESESLIATGAKDGYIRLDKDAYEKYAGNNLPENLRTKKVTILPVDRMAD